MSLPIFHETFLPVLKVLSHGNVQKTSDLPDQILEKGYIALTPEEASLLSVALFSGYVFLAHATKATDNDPLTYTADGPMAMMAAELLGATAITLGITSEQCAVGATNELHKMFVRLSDWINALPPQAITPDAPSPESDLPIISGEAQ